MDINAELEQDWPNLSNTQYRITSPHTPNYNCLAWAIQEDDRWWSPLPEDDYYWPEGVPREVSVAAFIKAYETLGFSVCESGEFEKNTDKLALYVTSDGKPQSIARQLPNGLWTSKLGRLEDIEHEFTGLNGKLYGTVHKFMTRSRLSQQQLQQSAVQVFGTIHGNDPLRSGEVSPRMKSKLRELRATQRAH